MAQINYTTREIIAKIVYYGPSWSGKTTNLQWLYRKLDPQNTGRLFSLETEGDRTLFFDLLPISLENVRGMNIRLKVYTVPGQVKYNATRKLVLTGADAVVFVADSDPKQQQDNLTAFKHLGENLSANGLNIKTIPLVLQYNKRDLAHCIPIEVMEKKLNARGFPAFGSIAIDPNDFGVLESFVTVLTMMMKSLGTKYKLAKIEEIVQIVNELEHNVRAHIKPEARANSSKVTQETGKPDLETKGIFSRLIASYQTRKKSA